MNFVHYIRYSSAGNDLFLKIEIIGEKRLASQHEPIHGFFFIRIHTNNGEINHASDRLRMHSNELVK